MNSTGTCQKQHTGAHLGTRRGEDMAAWLEGNAGAREEGAASGISPIFWQQ